MTTDRPIRFRSSYRGTAYYNHMPSGREFSIPGWAHHPDAGDLIVFGDARPAPDGIADEWRTFAEARRADELEWARRHDMTDEMHALCAESDARYHTNRAQLDAVRVDLSDMFADRGLHYVAHDGTRYAYGRTAEHARAEFTEMLAEVTR